MFFDNLTVLTFKLRAYAKLKLFEMELFFFTLKIYLQLNWIV